MWDRYTKHARGKEKEGRVSDMFLHARIQK